MKIGNIKLNSNLILAPVAGISALPFRLIAREFGAGLCFTEMVSSEALIRNNQKTEPLLKTDPLEKPVGAQIFGAKPEVMATAASILEKRGFDIIDINAGCPVKKITRNNAGAALIKNPKLLRSILRKVRKNISIPLMLKIRSGWDSRSINAIEIAKIAEDCGVDAITFHPRTASQLFTGKADWNLIKQVKESIKIPVIGNGDVVTPEDAVKLMKETMCDGLMIGRGALGNPWIFKNTLRLLNNAGSIEKPLGKKPLGEKISAKKPSAVERGEILLKHLSHSIQLIGDKQALLTMRKQYLWYAKNLPGASQFRKTIIQKNSIKEVKQEIENYFFSTLTQKEMEAA